ncbi:hypothetical protein [Brachybacterium sacelli]|uniref:Uncharacterized protein n=1 Tax=Brachybacterium sacelli TaxID=173364 RepID=A0ABS4WVD5_9MICO|nr:hypothetical protein [Brachybacterium sacelli]MBP2380160.1 hypothetical protein [Brachybacterium sacelli]
MKAGLRYVLEKTYRAEGAVIAHLQALLERHPAEHEVRHVSIDLLELSRSNREHLAAVAAEQDLDLTALEEDSEDHDATVQGAGVEPGTPLGLLEDFRELLLRASGASLDWEMLAQHAQAAHERTLLDLASQCHPQTLRQIAWANTMLKTSSPQALASQ